MERERKGRKVEGKRARHKSALGAKRQAHTHLIHRGIILPVGDVVSDGACKQHRLLTDQTNVPAIPRWVQVSQVVPTYTPQE